nr:uncharacterized mitochondrial protein AtMg00810-like [Tanacetum cinerariifolium]
MQTQTSNTLHNAIIEAGGKDHSPMLAPDKTVPVSEGSSETTTETYMENYKNVSQDIRDQLNAEAEAVQIILTGIDNDIYSTADACPNACEMWKSIERFYKMLNELVRNQCDVTNHQVNVQFLLQLQPEWQRRKAIVNSPPPIYDQEPSMVAKDDEMSKDKEIDKRMALIYLSFKKIYKPTNNNFRTSSNTSRANHNNSSRINRGTGYDNQRLGNVVGARETVADWRDDTDDESKDQELEAHYMYMAQIQEVTPDNTDNSRPIFDTNPLQKLVEIILFNVDSGCSKHITGNLKLLINFVEKFLGMVKFGNDQIAHILGYRDLKSTCYIRDLKGNDLLTEGNNHQMSVAQTPEQNSVVKRWNRTLVEAARTMLSAAKVPLFFWAEAIATTCFTQNHRGETTSRHVDSSNMHTFYQRHPSKHLWTKDHPLEQVIGKPSQSVRIRRQLELDGEMCMFALTEELHQFDRLDVWKLVDRPLCKNIINMKWLWKNKRDEENTVIRNKSRLVAKGYAQKEGVDFEESFALALYGLKQAPRTLQLSVSKDQTKYQSMVGALMYLIASRPDIMHATCYCARYQAKPTEKHLTVVKRIFLYLKDTIHMGLWYQKDIGLELIAFSDSNHAGCLNSCKSTSGGIQFLGGDKLVSWSSKKQDCTLMSSAEAKYVSLFACCAQVLWIRTQLTDYGFHFDKIPMYCKSKVAIAISCNPV